jgi:glyoxylase-like metal-dependent hydrolase (beta-lactamase superfamily II)
MFEAVPLAPRPRPLAGPPWANARAPGRIPVSGGARRAGPGASYAPAVAAVEVREDYDGHTDPGGAAARRDLGGLVLTKVSVGPMDNNAYLLVCTATGEALLVDAAAEPDRLAAVVGDAALRTTVTTHRHHDHWQALAAVRDRFGTRQVAHPLDAPELPVPVDATVEHGGRIAVGDAELEVVHLRGHTPGSIALLYRGAGGGHLFTGDSLFPGGPGKTWSAADNASLLDDLEERVFGALPDDTWVYPGHGDDTTLGRERPSLPEWRARGW